MRKIPFGDALTQELKKWKDKQEKCEKLHREEYHHYKAKNVNLRDVICEISPCDKTEENLFFVCTTKKGKFVQQESFAYCTKIVRKELGIDFDFHTLRHTHASMLLDAGANIKSIQDRLGHSDASITLKTYTHSTEDMSKNVAEIFEKIANRHPMVAKRWWAEAHRR